MLMAAAVPLSATLIPMAADAARPAAATRCAALPVDAPPGAAVEAVSATAQPAGTVAFPGSPIPGQAPVTDVPARCEVTVTLTHPGAGDHVHVKIALPQDPKQWSGRFQATGGSAYLAGDFGFPLATGVKAGYVTAATDAGVGGNPVDVSGWALDADGRLDNALLTDFASRSAHDMAVLGKDIADRFYGRKVTYSYWTGCSTGGRQGYEEAQAYPTDFQGILANAPAIDWDRFAVATLWSQAVFNETRTHPSTCVVDTFTKAAIAACGNRDGYIDDPANCHWDARRLVGTRVVCDGQTITIDRATADAVNRIWAGPPELGYGPNKGADLASLGAAGSPFFVADVWAKYFVTRNPAFDTTKLTYRTFDQLLRSSERQFHDVIGSDDPGLSRFARAGGKLLSWHGQADQLVPTQGTVAYREKVKGSDVGDFYRLFLLPGVTHCGGGAGPQPTGDLDALVNWVEHGHAPATLKTTKTESDGTVLTRDVRPFPAKPVGSRSGRG
jgi:hypothetical protein